MVIGHQRRLPGAAVHEHQVMGIFAFRLEVVWVTIQNR